MRMTIVEIEMQGRMTPTRVNETLGRMLRAMMNGGAVEPGREARLSGRRHDAERRGQRAGGMAGGEGGIGGGLDVVG